MSSIVKADDVGDIDPGEVSEHDYLTTIFWLWANEKYFEAMKLLWRDRIVDCLPSRRLVAALAKYRKLIVIGHGSASKTFTATAFNMLKWWSNPSRSAFVLTSSTIKSLSNRAWADLKLLVRDVAVPMPGKIMASQYKMRYDYMDDKHLVMAVSGEDEDSVTKIQGLHTEQLNLLVDEADNPYNVAIWKAMANLGTSGDFQVAALANPIDRNSVFGMNCEPVDGWESIELNSSFEWESRTGYHVVRLDGLESPNIKAGEIVYPFLLTPLGVRDIINEFGENSPNYFTYVRGWFPDIGAVNTMFSGAMVSQMERQEIKFYADSTKVAACDPSLGGGNRCVVAIGRAGLMAEDYRKGCFIVDSFHYVQIKNVEMTTTADFATQIKELCVSNGVEPENFAIGASTADLGIRDYLVQDWSDKIMSVDPAGAPTRRKILQEDSRNCDERFDRYLTEMWWTMREWVRSGQMAVRCVSRDLRIQLESRRWTQNSNNRLRLETKEELKKRGLKSPDECLVSGTKILSEFGEKNIEDIEVGDLVWTCSGLKPVVACRKTGTVKTFILTTESGQTLQGSGNHPVFTWAGELKRLDSLSNLDRVIQCKKDILERSSNSMELNSSDIQTQKVAHLGFITIPTQKHCDQSMEPCTNTFTENTLEKSQKTMTSITKMETLKIIQSKTFNVFQTPCIKNYTQLQIKKLSKKLCMVWKMREKLLRHGMVLMKEKDGMPIMQKFAGRKDLSVKLNVLFAEKLKRQSFQAEQDFVMSTVLQNICEQAENYKSSDFVKFAGKSFSLGCTTQLQLAPDRVATLKEAELCDVYNLRVDGNHQYFANRILTHNSDALSNMAELVRSKFGDLEATGMTFDPSLRTGGEPVAARGEGWRDEFEPNYKNDPVLTDRSTGAVESGGDEFQGESSFIDGNQDLG